MENNFQDINQTIINNRNIVKNLLKDNNLNEIDIPQIEFQMHEEDWDYIPYYFIKVALGVDSLSYYYTHEPFTDTVFCNNVFTEDEMGDYIKEENEVLKYIYETLK